MRTLDTKTLDGAARYYAARFLEDSGKFNRDWVMAQFYNFSFKDEFDYLRGQMAQILGPQSKADFNSGGLTRFTPRTDEAFQTELRGRLAIDPDGAHLKGMTGYVETGRRIVGYVNKPVRLNASIGLKLRKALDAGEVDPALFRRIVEDNTMWVRKPVQWPVYFGEEAERAAIAAGERGFAGEGGLDAIDPDPDPLSLAAPLSANVTNISAEACMAALDAIRVKLDEGSTAASIRGRTGAQPADPDAAESGTLLFTLTCTDPAVAAAADDTDGTCSATFSAITDDSSADATGTLGYCRFGATGTGVDDHIDGNSTTDGTGATDWNTLSIVSGSTVSMTSAVIGQSQGSTAT